MSRPTLRAVDHIVGLCLVIATCLVMAMLPLGAVANAPSDAAQSGPRLVVRHVDHRLDVVRTRVLALERIARRVRIWMHCIRTVPVDEIGDESNRFGFLYDQVDGTGLHHRKGLVVHDGPGRGQFALLAFARRPACYSAPVTPNGTGADAKSAARQRPRQRPPIVREIRKLQRRITTLESRIAVLERVARRFDEWESCLSAIPLTEQGDPVQRFGYHYQGVGGRTFRHAIDIDTSEWDDPDYQLLAFIGRDRPFRQRECSRDPGEAPDKAASHKSAARDSARRPLRSRVSADLLEVARDSRDLAEDLPDLRNAIAEFTSFDQCMFTVGVSYLGSTPHGLGYLYSGPLGRVAARPAMALALDGAVRPRWDFLAFPGEEPPQIECNEDAGGQDTEE